MKVYIFFALSTVSKQVHHSRSLSDMTEEHIEAHTQSTKTTKHPIQHEQNAEGHRGYSVKKESALPAKTLGMKRLRDKGLIQRKL